MLHGCDGYVGIVVWDMSGLSHARIVVWEAGYGWIVVYADCHYCIGWAEGCRVVVVGFTCD